MRLTHFSSVCIVAVLAGCGGGSGSTPTGPSSTSVSAPPIVNQNVRVVGNQFFKDGVLWSPHGLNVVAFVPSPSVRTGLFGAAYSNFNASELAAMKQWGVDTLRFQVSQPALDFADPLYSSSFLGEVVNGVKEARAMGLNVIVSVQDESGTGEPSATPLPNVGTGHAWAALAPQFAGDNGVLFEILNEPEPAANPANWALWAAAMNDMVTIIRGASAKNVLIADGLNFAEQLDGAPTLDDPLHQVAYGSHPYAHSVEDQTPAEWAKKFGNVSISSLAPVVVTEWSLENTPTKPPQDFQYCDAKSPNAALSLLGYLATKNIGLLAFSYDLPNQPNVPRDGRVMLDAHGTPSTLTGSVDCTSPTFGPGRIVQTWYRTGIVPPTLE